MTIESIKKNIETVLELMPSDWVRYTTHRLDIYNESRAKVEFLEEFEKQLASNDISKESLSSLPTAFDYIRLGHPLSCVLEWALAKINGIADSEVITFSSETMPILAILRKNLLEKRATRILFKNDEGNILDTKTLKEVYGYNFELSKVDSFNDLSSFDGSTIALTSMEESFNPELLKGLDFIIGVDKQMGSITLVNGETSHEHISEIQHVRRRESIAMTPIDCVKVLKTLVGQTVEEKLTQESKERTLDAIRKVTNTAGNPSLGSCGLSVQYAIMMGLIDASLQSHPNKKIKFIVPPNCYGGTNDQARRVAACVESVEILDLPVDGDNDMVTSTERVLAEVAKSDAVPFIIAEIPTNPRVEVPELDKLRITLSKKRQTESGEEAIAPVFILDQTFCPNVEFLSNDGYLSGVKTISYVSGSKFPSGGLVTAGYCVANSEAESLMAFVEKHLVICRNTATDFQIETLAEQMPSMNKRIDGAYKNTRGFVNHIKETLPTAKINFVSEELAEAGFTPSVFSLDLPTKGDTAEAKEAHKRDLNLKLINMMIEKVPSESKHCVSYGQLEGCYWTIPATSTQGTTKEGDKDYIVRVALSPKFNLELHNQIFTEFCEKYILL
jgi:cystathionine beta-lyase/cystathionine gamma-synthase